MVKSFVVINTIINTITPKTKYLPPKAKSHIWNPKAKAEIKVAILGSHKNMRLSKEFLQLFLWCNLRYDLTDITRIAFMFNGGQSPASILGPVCT